MDKEVEKMATKNVDQKELRANRGRSWWSELDIAGRIQRLRDLLKSQQQVTQELNNRLYDMEQRFSAHFHNLTGVPSLPVDYRSHGMGYINSKEQEIGVGERGPDDVYF